MDREKRFLVSSCSVTSPNEAIERIEWRETGDVTKKGQFQTQTSEAAEV